MKKGNWEKSLPVISVLMGDIMQSVENALLIGKISFAMMLLRGQACRWGTGSHMKAGSCVFLGKKQNWQKGHPVFVRTAVWICWAGMNNLRLPDMNNRETFQLFSPEGD